MAGYDEGTDRLRSHFCLDLDTSLSFLFVTYISPSSRLGPLLIPMRFPSP